MMSTPRILARLAAATALSLALLFTPTPDAAHAHGGQFQPIPPKPGDGGPKPPWRPPPPPPKQRPSPPREPRDPPTTPRVRPGDSGPVGRNPTPTTPKPPTRKPATPPVTNPTTPRPGGDRPKTGPVNRRASGAARRGRKSAGAGIDESWQLWWNLNRWTWLPQRPTVPPEPGGVVTPRDESEGPLDLEALGRTRRTLVVRQHIVPFLLKQLDPKTAVRPEVRAASMIALCKVSHDTAAINLVIKHMQDPRADNVVRESAAWALGMLRRTRSDDRMEGAALDGIRSTLLETLDDDDAPVRTRAFAAFAIGMVADQPYGSAFTKDGRMMSRALWQRTTRKYSHRDIPVALLSAIGMQPLAGTGNDIKEGLRRIVQGRRVGKRSWDPFERSHALAALLRQRGDGWAMTLNRTLTNKRLPKQVQRAALIAMGAAAKDLDDEQRLDAADAAMRGARRARDAMTRGLAHVALGRLLAADMGSEKTPVVERSGAAGMLIAEARHGSQVHRGFSALALALAVRGKTGPTTAAAKFQVEGRSALLRGFERSKDPELRSAYVVALGLQGAEAKGVVPALIEVIEDRAADNQLRGHSALAMAQIGADDPAVRRALRAALWDKRSLHLRSQAALALSFLGGAAESKLLVRELHTSRSRWVLTQVSVALGRLGMLDAVPAVLELAGDPKREDEARALAIASLGLLGDPEAKPTTLRLAADSNYPARTDALHEALTLL